MGLARMRAARQWPQNAFIWDPPFEVRWTVEVYFPGSTETRDFRDEERAIRWIERRCEPFGISYMLFQAA